MKSNTKELIIQHLQKHIQAKPSALARSIGISRVSIHKNLLQLIFDRRIEKRGLTPHIFYSLAKPRLKKYNPHYLWDYNYDELKKTEQGRIKILERMINYGPGEGEKIPLDQVKKYWEKLRLFPNAKRLMELLIWNKIMTKTKFPSEQELLGMDDDEFFAYCIKRHLRLLKENKGKPITSFQLKKELFRRYEKLMKNI